LKITVFLPLLSSPMSHLKLPATRASPVHPVYNSWYQKPFVTLITWILASLVASRIFSSDSQSRNRFFA